jgi:protein-S-isoprenylcysteine O-methyltransferase Ste14
LSLDSRAFLALVALAVVMGLLLFVPAGTIHYGRAWIYLAIFIGLSSATTLYLTKNDPALLQRRMSGGPTAEKEGTQKLIMSFESIGFVALLVVSAFDRRFAWSSVPCSVSIMGDALVAVGTLLIARVYRENSFAAATVEVFAEQKVVSTGPYAIVRHPMYASALLYLVGTPLALGSYWGLVPLAMAVPFLIWRLLDEEHLLAARLAGYADYQKRVQYHLVPFVW